MNSKIKSTVNAKQYVERNTEYPKLMVSAESGQVVLFWGTNNGVSLYTKTGIGDFRYSNAWDMQNFVPFHGSVTIEQE